MLYVVSELRGVGRHAHTGTRGRHARASEPVEKVSFGSLLAHSEFRALWVAGAQSSVGDQLARVALSVLVYARTGSGLATAATYALTFLPALAGGLLLSWLADRCPRKGLLIVCDLARAGLFLAMALPRVPLWLLCTLLAIAVFIGAPFKAAEPAVVADLFTGDRYTAAIGLRTATGQTAQLLGFAFGGLIVAAVGARYALAVDAATFAASAALIAVGLGRHPSAAPGTTRGIAQLRAGFAVVSGNRSLRALLGLSWLIGWWVVPEGLSAPYAAAHGGGAVAVGLLLAASPIGNLIGAVAVSRWLPSSARPRLIGLLAILSGLPLVACAADPGLVVAGVLWGLSGFFVAYQVLVVSEFVERVPKAVRGQAIGIASSGLLASQGAGLLIGGAIASAWEVAPAIAVTGAAGSLLAVPLAHTWAGSRARSRALDPRSVVIQRKN